MKTNAIITTTTATITTAKNSTTTHIGAATTTADTIVHTVRTTSLSSANADNDTKTNT